MEQTSIKLPADFETYGEARKAGFLRMKQMKDQGARVVGMFCSFVPTELVYAAGALPVGLCAFTEEPIPEGHPILALDNVTLTPHRAGNCSNLAALSLAIALTEVENILKGEPLAHPKN